MDLLFQKSLTDVIKAVRAASSPAEEAKILAKTLRDVRREIKSSDPRSKAAALEKLLYLHMLGHAGGSDIGWAAFPAVEAMGCHRSFAVKYVGYLAAAHCLSAAPDVALLATHQLRKDLAGQHPHDASLALACIASAAPAGLAAELTAEVVALLNGTRVAARRKATLAMLRIVHQQQQHGSSASGGGGGGADNDDDSLPSLLARLAERLHDSDRAVVTAVVSLVCELVLHEQHQRTLTAPAHPSSLNQVPPQQQQAGQQQQQQAVQASQQQAPKPPASKYLPLAPDLFPLLQSPSSSPWLLIKLVKTFAALAAAEPRVARKVAEPLAAVLRTTPSKSLLLECVRAVALSMRHVDSLRQLAIRVAATRLVANEPLEPDPGADGAGGASASSSGTAAVALGVHDANVRLLGLQALQMFLPKHASEVLRFKAAVIASLDDADPAVQSVALRLITSLVTRTSLVPSVAALRQRMSGAAAARSPFCGELVTAVLQMCGAGGFERVADFVWYLDVLQDICYVAIVGGAASSSSSLGMGGDTGAGMGMGTGAEAAAAAAAAGSIDTSVSALASLGDSSDGYTHRYSRRVSVGAGTATGLPHAFSAGAAAAEAEASSERGREVGRQLVEVGLGAVVPEADRVRVRGAALHLALRLVGDTALLRSRAGGEHVLASAAFLLGHCAPLLLLPSAAAAAAAAGTPAGDRASSSADSLSASSSAGVASRQSADASVADGSSVGSLLSALLQPSVLLLAPAAQAVFLHAALKVLLALTTSTAGSTGSAGSAGWRGAVASVAAVVAEAAGGRNGVSGVQWVVGVLEEAEERVQVFSASHDVDVADRACNVAALLGLLLPLLREGARVESEGRQGGGDEGEGLKDEQQREQQLLVLHTLASLFPALHPPHSSSSSSSSSPRPNPTHVTSNSTAATAVRRQQLLRAVERAAITMGVGPPPDAATSHDTTADSTCSPLAWLDAYGQSAQSEWDSGIVFVRPPPSRGLVPSSSTLPASRTASGGGGMGSHGGSGAGAGSGLGHAVPGAAGGVVGVGHAAAAAGVSQSQQVAAAAEGGTEEWRKRNSLFYLSSPSQPSKAHPPKADGRGKEAAAGEGGASQERASSSGRGGDYPAAVASSGVGGDYPPVQGAFPTEFPAAVGEYEYEYPAAVGDEAVPEYLPSRGSASGSGAGSRKAAPPLYGLLEEEAS